MNPLSKLVCLCWCILLTSFYGQAQQLSWAHSTGSPLIDASNTIYTDNAGDVYIAGKFSGTNVDFDPGAGTFLLSSAGSHDAFVAKYSPTGQFIWAFRFGGSDRDDVQTLTIDKNNNFIYITGYFRGSNVDFDPGAGTANLTSNGDAGSDPGYGGDIFVAKYSLAGVYQWAFNIGGTDMYDSGIGITTDAAGNVYVGGYFTLTVDFNPGAGTAILNSTNGGSIFLAKYTSAGVYQWAFNLGSGTTNNSMFDLATDPTGNVYATGYYQGANIDFDPGPGTAFLSSNGGYELFVAKYNTNGQYQFAIDAGGPGSDVGRGVAVDNAGNVYVIGDFTGANVDFDPGPGVANLSSNGQSDVVLAKYNSTGQYQWAFNFGGTPSEFGWRVIVDGSHLFVTGNFSGTADMDPSTAVDNLTSAGNYDIFLGKYTLNGEYLCSFRIGGSGNDYGYSVFSPSSNTFYLTGAFPGTNIDFDPGASTVNLSSVGDDDIYLAKYTWPDNLVPTGTISGNNICTGEQAQLTFNATTGVGPFTIVYNNGVTDITQTNVQSGVPFNILPNPSATTTYTLVSIKDAQRCAETNFGNTSTATIIVNSCNIECDGWLNLPSQSSFVTVGDLDVTGNTITVEALINRTPPLNNGLYPGHLVSKHTDQTNVNYALQLFGCEITTDITGYVALSPSCTPLTNKTYHIAMVYDGATLKFYRNGFLMAQTPVTGNMANNDLLTKIGQVAGPNNPFNNQTLGYVNEVRIWNVPRTQAEIRSNMNTSLANPTTQPGLLGYYVFDNLLNKQGNPAFNGVLNGGAIINQSNPACTFIIDSCELIPQSPAIIADFIIPDTVCVNTPVNIANTSTNATSFYWNFCSGSLNATPIGSNFASPNLSSPVFVDLVQDGANFYVFVVNHTGSLSRMNFGNSLLNAPTITNLGSFGGIIPFQAEGIEIQKDGNNWIGYIIGGQYANSRLLKLSFGNSVANTPTATNLGNIGGLDYPVDFTLIKDGNTWYGFTVSADNNTVTRYNFGNSLNNIPVATNLGNIGGLNYPVGIFLLKDVNNYHLFITNRNSHSISRLDFGTSVANTPTGTNLGNPGGNFNWPRDITVIRDCDKTFGFVTNESTNAVTRLDFNNNLISIPATTNLGNVGTFNFPSSISEIFRTGDAINFFSANVNSNSISRIAFTNCTNSTIPSYSGQTPPVFQYTQPGTYNVSMFADEGLATQNVICKQVVVVPAADVDFNYHITSCSPLSVQFTASGVGMQDPSWSFGDATSLTGTSNPLHNYSSQNNYVVQFSASNGRCRDTVTKTINLSIIPDDIIRTNDTTICAGTTKQLLTKPALSFCWSPTTYLDNPNSANPTTSTPQNIIYYYTAEVTGNNLIVNGDFTQGNTGFTSQYIHNNPNTIEGQYFIGTNPQLWNGGLNNCGDHTTGNANMMMVNGSPVTDANVWKQTVTVTPNTNYAFSTWIQALTATNPAQLQFSINGENTGGLITASTPACTWTQFYTTWNSGNNTTAVISIINKNTILAGNDFALDDISFAPVFIKRDSVRITVDNPIVKTNDNTTVCPGTPVQLNTTGAANYSWSPATGLNNTAISNPIAIVLTTTQYIVTGTAASGCIAKDTVDIATYPKPIITKAIDAVICKNTSYQLFVTGGSSYSWSPAATLSNSGISNPVASPIANTLYYITITDVNTCINIDSIRVNIRPDPIFTISAPATICENSTTQLTAGGGNIYAWQPATSLSNSSIANPVATPATTTNYSVLITETTCNNSTTLNTTVNVNALPTVQASKSNDIDCSNDRSQLNASGAETYTWTPAVSLNNPNIENPVAMPTSNTMYVVKGTDDLGCSNYDSVKVDFLAINTSGYFMPNAFTPNHDGLNDCYGIRFWGVIQQLEFSIYNRWGERIFFTKNPEECWDGTYKGKMQDIGVYVYMIKAKTLCGDTFKKGLFTLAR